MTLPSQFSHLSKYVEKWSLPDFVDRYEARVNSRQNELEEFYNALLPEMPAIMAFVDEHDLGDADSELVNLANMALSFMDVSPAVELFDSPEVPHGFDWSRMTYVDHIPKFVTKEMPQ